MIRVINYCFPHGFRETYKELLQIKKIYTFLRNQAIQSSTKRLGGKKIQGNSHSMQ